MARKVGYMATTLVVLLALHGAALGQAGRQARQNRPGGPAASGRPQRMMPGLPVSPGMQPDGAMGKLTAEIMALRELHAAGFTARDVEAAVAVLRELAESERNLRGRAEDALNAEKKALLASGPDDAPPPPAAHGLGEASQEHARTMARLFERLSGAIGEQKAGTIRRLVGLFPQPMGPGVPGVPMPGMGPGMPLQGAPGVGGRPSGPAPGQQPSGPGGPEPPLGPEGVLGRQGPMPPQGPVGPVPQGPGFGPMPPQGPPGQPMMGPPWMQPGNQPFPGMMPPAAYMLGGVHPVAPRLTVSELLDLLEQKLAAMKK